MRLRKETLPDKDPGQMDEQRLATHSNKQASALPPLGKHDDQLCASVQLFPKVVTPAHVHARTHTHAFTHKPLGIRSTKENTQHRREAVAGVSCAQSQTPGLSWLGLSPGSRAA